MRDEDDPRRLEGDGPSPRPSDQDPLEELEEEIENMDGPLGAEDHTTVAETEAGDTLDDRLAREEPEAATVTPETGGVTVRDEDAPDDEDQLVGGSATTTGWSSPEEEAMSVRERAPGATDHEDTHGNDRT